jgi:SAM-dependent methyltransferase
MKSTEKLFINETLQVYKGDDAAAKLPSTNDSQYFEEQRGVARVPKDRWRLAQAYEARTWLVDGAHAQDDRNWAHCEGFDNYRALEGRRSFERAIEIGCGPFTNLRIIGGHCTIRKAVLLDPLIQRYIEHRHCTYRNKKIVIERPPSSAGFASNSTARRLSRLLERASFGRLAPGIPIQTMVPAPIEDAPELGRFDLVVMINVIEHCFDLNAIFSKILSLVEPGGIFVFHDKLYSAPRVKESLLSRFDAGHPLRADRDLIFRFLDDNFDAIHREECLVKDGYEDIDLSEEGLYFVGRRRV